MSESATARYVMGYDDRERCRLQLQASIINSTTEQVRVAAVANASLTPGPCVERVR